MPTLFEIGDALTKVLYSVDESGEIDPELDAFFQTIVVQESQKLDCYVGMLNSLKAEMNAYKEEAEYFAKKAKAREAKADNLKARMLEHLRMTGRQEIRTAAGRKIKIQNNGGVCAMDLRSDMTIPDEFKKLVVDEKKIREALDGGEVLEFAELKPRGQHVRVY